jgi:hypothetical protein
MKIMIIKAVINMSLADGNYSLINITLILITVLVLLYLKMVVNLHFPLDF